MTDHILGICRFSYLGRGDWVAYKGTALDSAQQDAARQQTARTLFDPARLAFRFRTFQTLTLPSIAGQSDADFTFLVLTSPDLPEPWLSKLRALCDGVPQVRLLVSDATDVGRALAPELARIGEAGRLVQFRLDDDDCLSRNYVAQLRRAARAMQDYPSFAFSLPKALLVTRYAEGPQHYELLKPFHAAGAAARLPDARSIFAFGHFALPRRLVSVTDPAPFGSLQVKFSGHDSQEVRPSRGNGVTAIEPARFDAILQRDFPFLDRALVQELIAWA